MDDVRTGRAEIERAAAEHDRAIDAEHFGALVPYGDGDVPDAVAEFIAERRPDVDPAEVVAPGIADLPVHLERLVEAGASKFVIVPFVEPERWDDHLAQVADAVLPLQM